MKSTLISLILTLRFSATVVFSQETLQNPNQANPAPPASSSAQTTVGVTPSRVNLPEGNGVWVVLIRRTGGFAGVSQEVTVNSTGKLNCALCRDDGISRNLSGTAFQSVTPSFSFGVAPVEIAPQSGNASATAALQTFCRDCFRTHITIQRRDADGKVETYAATWDDLTSGQQPSEFVRLADSILGLAK